jgi:hypothetical protein
MIGLVNNPHGLWLNDMNVTAVKEFTHAGCTVEFETRHDFARLAGPGSIGAELGTSSTDFCISILQRDEINFLYTIDEYKDQPDEFSHAINTINAFKSKGTLVRETFEIAATQFDNDFFDWIYVNALVHDGKTALAQNGQTVEKTLTQWWPKLKSCGVFGGNGYDMTMWPELIKKLHLFALDVGRDIYIIDCAPGDGVWGQNPSWFIIK